jgi:predicted O-methyltransferase YrrM
MCDLDSPADEPEWYDPPSLVSDAEIMQWYDGKTFTCDWTTNRIPVLSNVLAGLRDKPARLLEIGSWEGRSAIFFLNYLPLARIVCIDPFVGNVEHQQDAYFAALVPQAEALFDANLASFGSRVEKLKGPSSRILPELGLAGRRFDAAYIDGSHFAADVYADALLTWPLIERGGIVVFDDYEWNLMDHERERPKLGIEAFLRTIAGQYREIFRSYQLAIMKL